MDSVRSRVHSQQALAVYAESLAAGGAVALFGDASLGLGQRLVDLGARSVHVWDPDPVRAAAEAGRAPEGVTVHAHRDVGALGKEVDLAIVPDLGLFTDASEVIARSRDLVGESGVLLVGAANREVAKGREGRAFEYYELFDLVARDFKGVTMVAELPFHGVALVALGDEGAAAEVSVDTQLASDERVPQRFVVIASQRDVELEPYTVVELPRVATDVEPPPKPEAGHAERTAKLEAALAERERELSELSSHVGRLRAEAEVSANEVHGFEEKLGEQARNARSLQVELERRDQMVRELVDRLQEKQNEQQNGQHNEQDRETGSQSVVPVASPDADLGEENGRLRELLDSMALEAARRESDARATAWTVSELERRLELALERRPGSPEPPQPGAHPPPTNSR